MTHFTRLIDLTSAEEQYIATLAQTLSPCVLRPRTESSLTMDEQGTLSKPIMDLMTDDFNMYHIQTSTQDRAWLNAPITYVSFYVNPDIEHFATPLKKVKDLYNMQSGFIQVISGDAKNPPRHDPQGWMKDGNPVVIMLSGWESEETLGVALKNGSVKAATQEVNRMTKETHNFATTFTVVEKTRWEHKWRRLPEPYLKDIPI